MSSDVCCIIFAFERTLLSICVLSICHTRFMECVQLFIMDANEASIATSWCAIVDWLLFNRYDWIVCMLASVLGSAGRKAGAKRSVEEAEEGEEEQDSVGLRWVFCNEMKKMISFQRKKWNIVSLPHLLCQVHIRQSISNCWMSPKQLNLVGFGFNVYLFFISDLCCLAASTTATASATATGLRSKTMSMWMNSYWNLMITNKIIHITHIIESSMFGEGYFIKVLCQFTTDHTVMSSAIDKYREIPTMTGIAIRRTMNETIYLQRWHASMSLWREHWSQKYQNEQPDLWHRILTNDLCPMSDDTHVASTFCFMGRMEWKHVHQHSVQQKYAIRTQMIS